MPNAESGKQELEVPVSLQTSIQNARLEANLLENTFYWGEILMGCDENPVTGRDNIFGLALNKDKPFKTIPMDFPLAESIVHKN